MAKHVVVIASGETERRALPYLVSHLKDEDIFVDEVRIPAGTKPLNVEMAEKLVKASWFEKSAKPDKFVVLVDSDGKSPEEVLRPFREKLSSRLGAKIQASLQFAYAQWHLEAWYFADVDAVRKYLGRAPGVDASKPDEIQNPKHHLKQLLGDQIYTAGISEKIASELNPRKVAETSPSFRGFLAAVRNGTATE